MRIALLLLALLLFAAGCSSGCDVQICGGGQNEVHSRIPRVMHPQPTERDSC